MKRIRDVAGRTMLVTAAIAVGLSGCSALSPATITETYSASDGTNLNLPGSAVKLRNFLVIGAEKGAEAVVVGAVINDGQQAVQVSLQATLGETAQPSQTLVSVGPNSTVQVGPDQKFEMTIPELPVEPGATTVLSAATAGGGTADLTVPVLRPEDEYSSITPAPTTEAPTPSETPTATATKKPKVKKTPSTDVTPTEEPTDS